MRILVVESDAAAAQTFELQLESAGFNVYTTDNGEEGIDLAKIYKYDAIALATNLADISGFEVLRALRRSKIETPILMLSGSSIVSDKVGALNLGADDYVTKPYHTDEVIARLRALVRRANGHAQSIIQIDDLAVNVSSKTVTIKGRSIHLTGKEYGMLELLALRKGMTITKEAFLQHLYGGMDEPELKIIDVFICKLRKKFRALAVREYIETIWGRGYVLRDAVDMPATPYPRHRRRLTPLLAQDAVA